MSDYDVGKAFERIEDDLISSMIRNLKHHKAEELEEGFEWEQWQAVQLKALDDYKKRNREKFPDEFDSINTKVKELIQDKYSDGQTSQEKKILQAIGKGYKGQETNKSEPGSLDISGKFFKVNDRKLNSLIDSTVNDLTKAEHSVLRRADDQYRKIIFSAHMYAESGGTYEKAVDMATKDFLSSGIDCIEYRNGARHTISDYADMAVKTAGKRAYLRGEGQKRNEWGIHTVIVNKRGNPCPLCLPWVGKVLIDDVYSGGTPKDGNYPLVSEAMAKGFLHPRCRDAYTTYFEGISTPPKEEEPTKEEAEHTEQQNALSEKAQHAEREQKRCERISKYSLDSENQRVYHHRSEQWGEKAEEYRKSAEALEKSFTARENSKVKALNPVSVVDKKMLDSSDYRKHIDKLGEDTKTSREIYHQIKEILLHRTGSDYEDLAFLNPVTGEVLVRNDYNKSRQCLPSKAMRKMVTANPNAIISIHNHPNSSVPSIDDICTAWNKRYKYGIIACHNGNLYKYTIVGEYNTGEVDFLLDKLNRLIYDNNRNNEKITDVLDELRKNNVEMEVFLWE